MRTTSEVSIALPWILTAWDECSTGKPVLQPNSAGILTSPVNYASKRRRRLFVPARIRNQEEGGVTVLPADWPGAG